jgi:hypothetical protein
MNATNLEIEMGRFHNWVWEGDEYQNDWDDIQMISLVSSWAGIGAVAVYPVEVRMAESRDARIQPENRAEGQSCCLITVTHVTNAQIASAWIGVNEWVHNRQWEELHVTRT